MLSTILGTGDMVMNKTTWCLSCLPLVVLTFVKEKNIHNNFKEAKSSFIQDYCYRYRDYCNRGGERNWAGLNSEYNKE